MYDEALAPWSSDFMCPIWVADLQIPLPDWVVKNRRTRTVGMRRLHSQPFAHAGTSQ